MMTFDLKLFISSIIIIIIILSLLLLVLLQLLLLPVIVWNICVSLLLIRQIDFDCL